MTMHPQRIVLYGAPTSPYVARVRIALEEAKAPYEMVFFDLDEKPQWFVEKVNSEGKVPALLYGGPPAPPEDPSPEALRLFESAVLLEFIADLFPNAGLLPSDPVLREKARFFTYKLNETIFAALGVWLTNADAGEQLLDLLATLQGLLPPEGYVAGEWSIADAAFAPVVAVSVEVIAKTGWGAYVRIRGDKVLEEYTSPRFARLREYMRINMERPSFRTSLDLELVTAKWLKRFASGTHC
ncbi:thioredoxin-like protein [Trametes cingulata]|nr:thioredoxin-like protein [Trametes cingulata]